MDSLKLFLVKVLKKLKILKYLNFSLSKTINGARVNIPFINGMGISNFIIETDWLDEIINLFENNNESAFMDVGANIGQSLIKLKTLHPGMPYLGFDPNANCISYVEQLAEINNFEKIALLNCALSNKSQVCQLGRNKPDDLSGSIIFQLRPGYFTFYDPVISAIYDSHFENQRISLVKIDVEGSELEVIKGMEKSIKKYQPVILCEVLDSFDPSVLEFTQSRASELSDLLQSLNYFIIQLEKSSKNKRIRNYKKMDHIDIRQWTPKSQDFNDYIFYPAAREFDLLLNLHRICTIK